MSDSEGRPRLVERVGAWLSEEALTWLLIILVIDIFVLPVLGPGVGEGVLGQGVFVVQTAPARPRGRRQATQGRLIRELGRGAMGVVYRARHRRLDMPAAVKMTSAPSRNFLSAVWYPSVQLVKGRRAAIQPASWYCPCPLAAASLPSPAWRSALGSGPRRRPAGSFAQSLAASTRPTTPP